MRRVFNLVLTVCLVVGVSGIVLAEEPRTIDLAEAVSMALEQNLDLRVARLSLENSELEYEKAKATNLASQSKYSELSAEHNLVNAQNTYRSSSNNIISSTLQRYSSLLNAQLSVVVSEKRMELEERLLAQTKAQVEVGDLGNLDLLQEEIDYNNAVFNLEKARNTLKQSLREFKALIGVTEEVSFSSIKVPTIWEIEEETVLSAVLANSVELQLKKNQVELASINVKVANVTSTSQLDRKITENKLKIAEIDLESTKNSIVREIQTAYYDFQQSIASMGLEKQNLQEAEERQRIEKEQRDAGLKTDNDVLQMEITVLETRSRYESAVVDYYLNQLSLKQSMYLETEVLVDDLQ